jgi:hypothetical protein
LCGRGQGDWRLTLAASWPIVALCTRGMAGSVSDSWLLSADGIGRVIAVVGSM